MKTLPLYESYPVAATDREFPEAFDSDCTLCSFHEHARKSVCLKPVGVKGRDPTNKEVLLVVMDMPSGDDDMAGKPFNSRAGRYFRGLVGKLWSGPIIYDTAVRCAAGTKVPKKRTDIFKKHVDPCRPYLAHTLMEAKPSRIIALGAWSIYSLLGRGVTVQSVRRGYGFMKDATPVHLMDMPGAMMRNPFLKKIYEADLVHAMERTIPPMPGLGNVANLVDSKSADAVVRWILSTQAWHTVDIETAGKMHDDDFSVVSVAVSVPNTDDSWVWERGSLKDETCVAALRTLITSLPLVAHGSKFDLKGLCLLYGVDILSKIDIYADTELMCRLNQANILARLELAAEQVGMGGHKEEADYHLKKTIAAARKKNATFDEDREHWGVQVAKTKGTDAKAYAFGLLPDNVLSRYNALDTLSTTHYAKYIRRELEEKPRIMNVWEKLTKPAITAFAEIELNGIAVDRVALTIFQAYLKARATELRRSFEAFGKDFNPGSHPQVRKVLYEVLGMTPVKFTDTGLASTGAAAIAHMGTQHPFVDDLIAWRSITKMDSTYATGMEKFIRDDGRIHPRFKLDGTETGRLSCEQPNGQNIPRADTKEGKMAKDIFTASVGCKLIQLDYGQQELRVAALLSNDEVMIAVFASGHDFHMRTAEMVAQVAWGISPAKWAEMTAAALADPENDPRKFYRTLAKAINFGLLYGKTDSGLAETLSCTKDEAGAIRRAILGKFKKLAAWLDQQKYYAKKHGGIWIPWDAETARWRPLPDIKSQNTHKASNAVNASINTPIQGRASDYCLAAIPRVMKRLKEDGIPARVVLTVHDSIIIDSPEWCVDETVEVCREVMTAFDTGDIPLVVDAEVGFRWGSLKPYKTDAEVAAEELQNEAGLV